MIPKQCSPEIPADKDWMALLLSDKSFQVWATPMDRKVITGIPPLELCIREQEMPYHHQAAYRNVATKLTDIMANHIDKFIKKGLFPRSNSAKYTSPTVIAPKATPFFRLAVAYR